MSSSETHHQNRFLTVSALLISLLTGCQPVPTPFAHTPGTGDPIITQRPDIAGITVKPITGLTKQQSDALSKAMVNAFMAMEIPAATTGENRHSKFINGTAKIAELAKNRSVIQIEWSLTDSLGKPIERHETRHRIISKLWTHPNSKSLLPWVKPTARIFARSILGARLDTQTGNQTSIPRLHVWPIDGIDEIRSTALKTAMERSLKSQKFPVLKGLDGAMLIIAGSVSLGPAREGKQPIEVNWVVLDAKGKQVGKLDQRNAIAVSTVKRGWQSLALIIAQNAAGGVSEIVNRLPPDSFPQRKKTRR